MLITPKIGLDLDGVVVPFHENVVDACNSRYGGNLTVYDINCELESLGSDLYKKIVEIFNEPNWFINLRLYPNVMDTLSKYVAANYNVTICTAPARDMTGFINPASASEKFQWIRHWLPFWANNVIITKQKELINTDMLVDDTWHNIINWCNEHPDGIGVLIDKPWNKSFTNYPVNSIRGSLEDVITLIDKFWCQTRGKFVYRIEELSPWKK